MFQYQPVRLQEVPLIRRCHSCHQLEVCDGLRPALGHRISSIDPQILWSPLLSLAL